MKGGEVAPGDGGHGGARFEACQRIARAANRALALPGTSTDFGDGRGGVLVETSEGQDGVDEL